MCIYLFLALPGYSSPIVTFLTRVTFRVNARAIKKVQADKSPYSQCRAVLIYVTILHFLVSLNSVPAHHRITDLFLFT